RPITCGKLRVHEQVCRLLHHLDKLATGNFSQNIAGALRLAHVACDQSSVRLAYLCHRLTSCEVDYLVDFEAGVGLPPSEEWKVNHQYAPTVVVAANPLYGLTPLTPSHG